MHEQTLLSEPTDADQTSADDAEIAEAANLPANAHDEQANGGGEC